MKCFPHTCSLLGHRVHTFPILPGWIPWSHRALLAGWIPWSHRALLPGSIYQSWSIVKRWSDFFLTWLHRHWTTQQLFGMFCYLCKTKNVLRNRVFLHWESRGKGCLFSPICGRGKCIIITWISVAVQMWSYLTALNPRIMFYVLTSEFTFNVPCPSDGEWCSERQCSWWKSWRLRL